jgi:hypothetical protein
LSFRDAADGEADWRRPGIQKWLIISGFRVRSQLTLRAPSAAPIGAAGNDSLSVLEVPDAAVNTMAIPASSAALMTSSSRIDPPGWITAPAIPPQRLV